MVYPMIDDELERMNVKAHRRKWLWYGFRSYPSIFLRKNTTFLGHNSWSPSQDLN
jgi:hypothetical protein